MPQVKRLNDGTYLVATDKDNINASHWHVAPDGTVLSVKEGGSHVYNRGDTRKKIDEVLRGCGISIPHGWRP